jgi:hypothetical protein
MTTEIEPRGAAVNRSSPATQMTASRKAGAMLRVASEGADEAAVDASRGRRESRIVWTAWCTIGLSAAFVLFNNLRFGRDALAVGFADDFFYYAQVARNFALHGVSTFDGIHLTNGYHPLWMLVLALLTKVFGMGGMLHAATVIPFAAALDVVQFSLVMVIAYFAFRVLRQACDVTVTCCLQLLLVIFYLILVRMGMEVGLTMAILLGLLWFRLRPRFEWSVRESFLYGLIAGMMVLSRLDSILFVGLLLLFDVLAHGANAGARKRSVLWFCVGMWPVLVYVALNIWIFHMLLPVSGTAKQLRMHHLPSLAAIQSLRYLLGIQGFFLLGPCVLTACGLIVMATGRYGTKRGSEGLFWAALTFPVVHLLTIVTLSDWGIWPWYLYPWPVASVVAGCVIWSRRGRNAPESRSEVGVLSFDVALACLVIYAAVILFCFGPQTNQIYMAGMDISRFAQSHPGVYAMGDRAGAVGYLVNQPVIQLEGLMMDREFLRNIRAERDLQDVFKQYHVRYYIFTSRNGAPDADGCFRVKEPAQAGPDSPTMKARICKVPVAVFRHEGFVNDVFQMY